MNIVFCADGTWDDPNNNSNVIQLYKALDVVPNVQAIRYDSGVGADGNPIEKILGGGMGAGLFQKIKDGYSAIAALYQPGDDIFLFGFSRGAYTVRSLAGMIAICGLPTIQTNDPKCVDMAFAAYRHIGQRAGLLNELNAVYRMDNAKIRLLGVWDTVGSLGIPALFGDVDIAQYGFLDTGLHPDVLNAVQALAIDERRMQFQATLWTSAPAPGQTITQCWFAGVHCDVGGGYAADTNGAALSNTTFLWMASFAATFNLKFRAGVLPNPILPSPAPDALATLHNSRTGLYRIFPAHVRNIIPTSSIASSVNFRLADAKSKYSPTNLNVESGNVIATYSLVNV
jgi:uncharacterized protein (DUF2235 family)